MFYSPNNSSSKALAQILQDTIKGQLQNDNTRQIKQATDALYLLYNAQIPAVMVECGFLSNPEEAAKAENERISAADELCNNERNTYILQQWRIKCCGAIDVLTKRSIRKTVLIICAMLNFACI